MTYTIVLVSLFVIVYMVIFVRKRYTQSKLQIINSESQFIHSGCYCHPSTVASWVDCKVDGSNIRIHFTSAAWYSFGYTRVIASKWDEDFSIWVNGEWEGPQLAKLFVLKYWSSLVVLQRAKATKGFALPKQRKRQEKAEEQKQERVAWEHQARELVEARKKINKL